MTAKTTQYRKVLAIDRRIRYPSKKTFYRSFYGCGKRFFLFIIFLQAFIL
jgi:hypothetical protein